jgi:hypothetical protein
VPECTWHISAPSLKLSAVAGNGAPDSRKLSAQDVTRIAEAFEVSGELVLADAALAAEWLTSEQALLDQLRDRHDWDASMSPYYLFWLRGDGGEPPD